MITGTAIYRITTYRFAKLSAETEEELQAKAEALVDDTDNTEECGDWTMELDEVQIEDKSEVQ